MSNCLECGKKNPPSKGYKKRKYCSKKCANKYLRKDPRTKSYYAKKNPNWGSKTREKAEEIKRRKEEYERYDSDPNFYQLSDIAKEAGLTKSSVSRRATVLEIEPVVKISYDSGRQFYNKEQVDCILDYENQMYPMPAGCITTQEVLELLDITEVTFMRRKSFIDLEPEGEIVRNGSPSKYYIKKKVIQFEADWQQRQIDRQEEISQRQKERLEQIQREQKEFEEWFTKETKGLLSSKEFAIACGTKGPPAIVDSTIKVRGYGNYYHPDKVEEYKIRKQNNPNKIQNPAYGRMPTGIVRRTPLRKDKWTDPKPYVERRLLLEARSYDTSRESYKRLADKFKADAAAWKANGYSNPRTKQCTVCKMQKPFYDYYKGSSKCRSCRPKSAGANFSSVETRIQTAFVITIKQELSKGNKKYNAIPNCIIWDEIEKHLGYTKEDYLNHLQRQFEPWMDWSCWGRTRRNKDGKCWEVDHIIPRSKYKYTDIDTPEFKEIWALENIRPLSRKKNLEKGFQ
jgi:hypothetical protein